MNRGTSVARTKNKTAYSAFTKLSAKENDAKPESFLRSLITCILDDQPDSTTSVVSSSHAKGESRY